jgi:hypothetical protein
MAGTPTTTRVPLHEVYYRRHGQRLIDPKQRRLPRDPVEVGSTDLPQAGFGVVPYSDTTSVAGDLVSWCNANPRSAGEWWTTLHDDNPAVQRIFRGTCLRPDVVGLSAPAAGQQRLAMFNDSLAAFARHLTAQGYSIPKGRPPYGLAHSATASRASAAARRRWPPAGRPSTSMSVWRRPAPTLSCPSSVIRKPTESWHARS